MPTYEYRCKACGHELEVVQSFADDPLTTCQACGGELRKVFGNVGIAFKGSGFYKNDSRGRSTAAATPGGDKAGAGANGGSGGDAGSPAKKDTAASASPSGSGEGAKAPSSTPAPST